MSVLRKTFPLEIVVGVDSRTPRPGLGDLEVVADRLVGFEFTGANRFRPWLREQARGEWLLLLDSDELPSRQLLEELPRLLDDRSASGITVPRLTPLDGSGRYPVGGQWRFDRQLRLVRNDGRLVFPAFKHSGAWCEPPVRHIDAPIIHLALLVDDEETRRAKVSRYAGEAFGLLTVDGHPLNPAQYLPEDYPAPGEGRLDPEDRAAVEAALARLAKPGRALTAPVPIVSGGQVERWTPDHVLDPAETVGSLELAAVPSPLPAGATVTISAVLRNGGPAVWSRQTPFTPHPVNLSYQWRTTTGDVVVADGLRTPLPIRVLPGETVAVDVAVQAPDASGRWRLVVDVVQEGVRWFGLDGTADIDVEPSVSDCLRAAADPLVPVATVVAQRRRLEGADALSRSWAGGPEGVDPSGLPVGGWALDQEILDYLVAWMEAERLTRVLEFGSGTSTVVLATAAARLGGRVLSVDQSAEYADRTLRLLAERGLDGAAQVRTAGLTPVEACGVVTSCYDLDPEFEQAVRDLCPHLVVIDGPSQVSGASRVAVLPSLVHLLSEPTRFVLDDAMRDAEIEVARHWSAEPGIAVEGVALVGGGLLVGTVHPDGRPPAPRRSG